jgi:fumigallin biosynthesis monooxygenase-like protein
VARVDRRTVDLSGYPDLVVIYLGPQVYSLPGIRTLLKLGPGIRGVAKTPPDGLLHHDDFLFAQFPLHVAFRQYWRDFDSLEAWTRTLPHQRWWRDFLKDSGGTGFWHEAHSIRGGLDSVYDDMRTPPGLAAFAPSVAARGPLFSSRGRLRGEASRVAPVVDEEALDR